MDEDDLGPELNSVERVQVKKKAAAIASLAQLEAAQDLLPFGKADGGVLKALPDNQRRIATWLLVNSEFQNFYKRTFESKTKVVGSGHVYKNPTHAGTFDTQRIQSFAHLCQTIAEIFCGHVDSDEIRELRAMRWRVECEFYNSDPQVKSPAPYVHKPSVRDRVQQGNSSDLIGIMRKRRSRQADATLITDGPFVLRVVEQLGEREQRALAVAYEQAYADAFQKEEEFVRSDPKRSRKLSDRERRRERRAENGGLLRRFKKRDS